MTTYYKKRRGPQGPNKNEEKVQRGKSAENQARLAGALGSRFPSVKRLTVRLRFLDAKGNLLEEKTIALSPPDAAVFKTPCPGRCGQGSFDFEEKVGQSVAAKLPLSECSAQCPEPLYGTGSETCGCELRCRLELEYSSPAE